MTDPATFLVEETDLPALRNVLQQLARIGYCEAKVRERLGLADVTDLLWRALPVYRAERLAVRDPLSLAIDLFLLQGVIAGEELERLFGLSDREALVRAGVLCLDHQGRARARASLFPVGDCLVFSDHAWPKLPHPGCEEIPYDLVMSVGADSRWLTRATARRPFASALDLCTGSGVQALLAARHARRVLAVDINARAARCTRFNAQASGADNLQVVVGDLYQPAVGERFELITANPPFVPSPLDSLGFRDGGRSGEDVQRRIVEGVPQHLAPGGIAQIVTEIGERDEQPLADRVRDWLGDAPLDMVILRLREHSAASYAVGHAQGDRDFGVFLDSVRDWADNLRTQGYTRVVSVLIAFQWSDPASGPPWTLSVEALPPVRDLGQELEAMFVAERLARRADLHDLLAGGRLRRAGPIGLMESQVLGSELRAKAQAQLLGRSLKVVHWLDPVERELLVLLEQPLDLSGLVERAGGLAIDKEAVLAATGMLLRRGLILLTAG